MVVPAFNEARHLPALLARCWAIGPAVVVVVDDCSSDGTRAVLEAALAAEDGPLVVLRNTHNLGKQGAVRLGLQRLAAEELDAVALIDGDLQHDPAELPGLAALLSRYDVVIGARRTDEMPLHRRFANWYVNAGFRLVAGVDFVDIQSGLRLYRKALADMLGERLSLEGRYGLEHESLSLVAQFAAERGLCADVGAAPITCAYGDEESSVRPSDVVQLAFDTFRQAWRFRRARRLGMLPAADVQPS